jgi:hypothetical protein
MGPPSVARMGYAGPVPAGLAAAAVKRAVDPLPAQATARKPRDA